jgi:hypothetical protein
MTPPEMVRYLFSDHALATLITLAVMAPSGLTNRILSLFGARAGDGGLLEPAPAPPEPKLPEGVYHHETEPK